MSYDNNNSGALFQNKNKKSESHPDYSGVCEVNGVRMYMAGWRKTSKTGQPYLSLTFSKEEKKPEKAPVKQSPLDDEIPF